MTIEEFIDAQIATDERVAKATGSLPVSLSPAWHPVADDGGDVSVADAWGVWLAPHLGSTSLHIARFDPERALRQAARHRWILERHTREPWSYFDDFTRQNVPCSRCAECESDWPCAEIKNLAAVWSDDPGFRPEWALTVHD